MTRMLRALIVCGAMLLVAVNVSAQVDRATLTGTVKDPQDALIPGATVTITNLATNVVSKVATNNDGVYLALNLMPGEYLVQVEATGFQKFEQTVALSIGTRARLDVSLPIGSLGEMITVAGVTPLLSTESAVLGTVVDNNEVSKLPLSIRNWDDLLAMVPGVQSDRYTEQAGGTSAGRTGGVSVHGNRSLQNNFLLDGVANNSFSTNVQELTTQISRPSVDAIQEFKVVTSPYAAEYGWSPGAAVIVNTKSGTNAIHGTGYDFFRNDSLDTINYFAKKAGQPKATNKQNQFGGNVGGPMMKNKAFFFFDYEGTRIEQGVLRTGRVLTAAERSGILSGNVRDPQTGLNFTNSTIPAGRIDPVASKIMALLPLPNTTGNNNFINQPNVEDESDRILGRVDLHLSDADNVFVRYIWSDRFRFVPGWFGGVLDGTSTSAWGRNYLKSHGVVGGWTKVLGSGMVNEARFSYARGINDGTQDPFGVDGNAQIGFNGVPNDPTVVGGIVGIDISGHIRLGSPNFMPKFQHTNQFQWIDTLTWLKGNHQWKFGADILLPMHNEYFDVAPTRGNLSFNGAFTGNAFGDFLLGYVQRAQLTNVFVVDQRLNAQSFYAQDDWKAGDKLTLNIGLRYDYMTPAYEANNRMANFDPSGAGSLVFAKDGSLEDRALVKPDRNNFSPRIGGVYKFTDRTIFRGGYGIFYNQFERIGSEDQLALNPPNLLNIDVQSAAGATTPVLSMANGFPAGFLDPANVNLTRIMIRASDVNNPRTMVQQFGGGIEHQMGRNFVASIDLIGSRTRNLAVLRNINQNLPGTRDANGPVPYTAFGNVQWREMTGRATYRGTDMSFEKRMSDGYSYRVSYTLGDAKDTAPEHLNASSGRPQNGRDLESWFGASDFDIRHRFVANFIAELPFGEGRPFLQSGPASHILGGWLVSGILSMRSGRPFTATQGNNNVGAGATGLPNLTGDPDVSNPSVEKWFDPTAFTQVASGTFGNSGRNILRGPGFSTFDMSIQRMIKFTDRYNTTVRLDIFNMFNRANFGLPDSNIVSATAGVISSLGGDPRVMQLSVRFGF